MNSSTAITSTRTTNRLTLLAILAVFVLPLLLAWLFVRGPLDWQPQSNLNYGDLIQPPLHLNSYGVMNAAGGELSLDAIGRDWFVVVLHDGDCSESCQILVDAAARIQLATGREGHRVKLASLSPSEEATFSPGLNWRLPVNSELSQDLRQSSGDTPSDSQADAQLLIVDYLGYVVLSYPPTEEGPGVLEDLKRLLRSAAG